MYVSTQAYPCGCHRPRSSLRKEEEELRVKEAYICCGTMFHVRGTIVIHFTVSLWVWCSDFLCFTLEESRAQRRKAAYPGLTQVVDGRVGIETPGYLQSLKLEIARRKRCVCVCVCVCVHRNVKKRVVLFPTPLAPSDFGFSCEREGNCPAADYKVGEIVLFCRLFCGDKQYQAKNGHEGSFLTRS